MRRGRKPSESDAGKIGKIDGIENLPLPQDPAERAAEYNRTVLQYEALDQEIDALLQANGGHTEGFSDEDFMRYRELAERRDLVYNRIKALERSLFDEI